MHTKIHITAYLCNTNTYFNELTAGGIISVKQEHVFKRLIIWLFF